MNTEHGFTVDQVQTAIAGALETGDVAAVATLVKYLTTIDADAARDVLETIEVGLRIAGRAGGWRKAATNRGERDG